MIRGIKKNCKLFQIFSLFFQCVIAWIMLIPESSNFSTLVNYFNFAAWTFYGATIAALLWLRIKEPNLKRPYKVSAFCKKENLFYHRLKSKFGNLIMLEIGIILEKRICSLHSDKVDETESLTTKSAKSLKSNTGGGSFC